MTNFEFIFVIAVVASIIIVIVHFSKSADSLSQKDLSHGRTGAEDPEVLRLLSGNLQANNAGIKVFSGGGTSSIMQEANQWFADNPHVYNVRAQFHIVPLPGAFTHWAFLSELRITYNVLPVINRRQYMVVEMKKYGILPLMLRADSVINSWQSNNPGARVIESERFSSYSNRGNSSLQIFALADKAAPERVYNAEEISSNAAPATVAPAVAVNSVSAENKENSAAEYPDNTNEKSKQKKDFNFAAFWIATFVVVAGLVVGGYVIYPMSKEAAAQQETEQQKTDESAVASLDEDNQNANDDKQAETSEKKEQKTESKADDKKKQYEATTTVNVRAEANQDSEKLGYLSFGDVVTGTGETSDNWLKIFYTADGSDPTATAWVSQNYLTEISADAEDQAEANEVSSVSETDYAVSSSENTAIYEKHKDFIDQQIGDFYDNSGMFTIRLSVGEEYKKNISWSDLICYSSDESVVTVSSGGKVTAVGSGTAYVVIMSSLSVDVSEVLGDSPMAYTYKYIVS